MAKDWTGENCLMLAIVETARAHGLSDERVVGVLVRAQAKLLAKMAALRLPMGVDAIDVAQTLLAIIEASSAGDDDPDSVTPCAIGGEHDLD